MSTELHEGRPRVKRVRVNVIGVLAFTLLFTLFDAYTFFNYTAL